MTQIRQTDEAARQTSITSERLKQAPTIGFVIDNGGRVLGVLAWFRHGDTMWTKVDDGIIVASASGLGDVIVKKQDGSGRVHTYLMADPATAFYVLGLSARRCNGIDGWSEPVS